MSKLTFVDLPDNVQEMVLSSVYAINKKNGYIDHTAGPAAVAQAIALLEYGTAEVATDPAKPGAEETVFQQAEAADPNPDYVDPEILDPKGVEDPLTNFLKALFKVPEQHCGRPECKACNELFGEVPDEGKANKLRFQQIDHKEGLFGPVDIYRSSVNPLVYAIMNRGKTALFESSNIELMSYQAAVEIVRVHGKEDRSIVG